MSLVIIACGALFVLTGRNKQRETANVKGVVSVQNKKRANAGEACGRSINTLCQKNLICAPLMPAYRLRNTTATEAELIMEEETVSPDVTRCVGLTEKETQGSVVHSFLTMEYA